LRNFLTFRGYLLLNHNITHDKTRHLGRKGGVSYGNWGCFESPP